MVWKDNAGHVVKAGLKIPDILGLWHRFQQTANHALPQRFANLRCTFGELLEKGDKRASEGAFTDFDCRPEAVGHCQAEFEDHVFATGYAPACSARPVEGHWR